MEWIDVLQRIENGEDAQTEFKRGLGDLSAVGRTICAFANGDGGLLVLGVDDSGGILGVKEDPENVQERLAGCLHTGCSRPVSADCGRQGTGGGFVHWINVRRHQRGYEPFNVNGRYCIRRGRSTVLASPSELQELFNVFGLVLTEKQVVSTSTARDIDFGSVRTFMRLQGKDTEIVPQPDIEIDLQNGSICEWHDGVLRPTLYGLMAFGRDPQGHGETASMFIQCSAYAGKDRATDVLSAGEARGRLDEQVERSVGWFRSLGHKATYKGLHRADSPLLPDTVLREVLVNAVIHRDYADVGSQIHIDAFSNRIDVTSPGTLPNDMTVEQARFGAAPRSRNEMMANAMVVRQLMERRGQGWLLMRHEMSKFNGTEPELVNSHEGRFVRVTFRTNLDHETPTA